MLSPKMEKVLNDQINAELYSGYMYQSMAAWLGAENFPGMARWMDLQAEEEREHAMKLYAHVLDRGGRVTLAAIDAPPTDFESPLAIFQAAYEHEQKVTGMIDALVDTARAENDKAAEFMLQWFVTEQVEEEANASEIVEKLAKVQKSPNGLFMMDAHLGRRGS